MMVRLSSSLCVMIAIISQLPAAQPIYDSWQELRNWHRDYYLKWRSYNSDPHVGGIFRCVSLHKIANIGGEHMVQAKLLFRNDSHEHWNERYVAMVAHREQNSIEDMIRTVDEQWLIEIWDQHLVFTNYETCRVLVHKGPTTSTLRCQLWMPHPEVSGEPHEDCLEAYTNYCDTAYLIYNPDCHLLEAGSAEICT